MAGISQILETVVGLGVIAWAVRDFLPLPEDLFKVNFRRAGAYCVALLSVSMRS